MILAAALGSGCRSASKPAPKPVATVVWRPAGSWSGHGNTQTESFLIESVQWRIKWETSNEKPPGAGRFQVIVDSAVSGRQIAVPVDHQGVGSDIAYINEDPHLFYLVIQSSHVDWSVKVEEAVVRPAASPAGGTQR
ncbi:MAG TPA: hypothetical protein VJ732_15615 [Bryobacteraceae bacterium]|nr:hypothetical protein [Bryobacteraceae bacterium]